MTARIPGSVSAWLVDWNILAVWATRCRRETQTTTMMMMTTRTTRTKMATPNQTKSPRSSENPTNSPHAPQLEGQPRGSGGVGADTNASLPAGRPGADPSATSSTMRTKFTFYQRSITPQS